MREQILDMVEMLDASPTIVDVSSDIASSVKRACRPEHLAVFVERLEGRWFGIVIDALSAPGGKLIPISLIDSKVDDLREEFGPDRLPLDYGGADPSAEAVGFLESRPFVEQLKLIGLGPTGQKMAIVDYFRAREQRSRWARDGLLRQNELTDYGRQLTEHWQRRWGFAEARVKAGMSDQELADIGMDVFSTTTSNCTFRYGRSARPTCLRDPITCCRTSSGSAGIPNILNDWAVLARGVAMSPAWSERSIEDQSLFNPAFCALLLRMACRGYQESGGEERALPLAHCFLILPIVLNTAMRSALPTLRTRMTTWIASHPKHIGDFADRSRELVDATREAIQLGCAQEWLAITGDGLRPGPHRFRPDPPRLITDTNDVRDCYKAARFVGRWLP